MKQEKNLLTRILNRILPGRQPSSRKIAINQAPAGAYVNNEIALTHTAVWCAVKLLAETIGVLNFKLLEPQANGVNLDIKTGKIYDLLNIAPNPLMSAATFRETLTAHVAGWGNGYAEIERDIRGHAVALWPLMPDRTKPILDDAGALWYEVTEQNGVKTYLPAADVFHIHAFGFDGLMGYDPISYHAQAISQGLAVEQHTSDFFRNGTHLNGALISKNKLDAAARKDIRDAYNDAYKGNGKAYRMAVFGNDLEWQPFSISPEASQLLESRKYKVSDIARIFRVPNHLLGDLEKATFSNIESQGIEFVQYTILPWAVRWESEVNLKLLRNGTPKRRAKMNLNVLMRGDVKSRFEAYKIGREWGWLSANDIRGLEDLNPIPGIAGTAYILPLNYQLAKDIGKTAEPTPTPKPPAELPPPEEQNDDESDQENESQAVSDAANTIANDIAKRAARRITKGLENKTDKEQIAAWFEKAKNSAWLIEALAPLADIINKAGLPFNSNSCELSILQQATDIYLNDQADESALKDLVLSEITRQITG